MPRVGKQRSWALHAGALDRGSSEQPCFSLDTAKWAGSEAGQGPRNVLLLGQGACLVGVGKRGGTASWAKQKEWGSSREWGCNPPSCLPGSTETGVHTGVHIRPLPGECGWEGDRWLAEGPSGVLVGLGGMWEKRVCQTTCGQTPYDSTLGCCSAFRYSGLPTVHSMPLKVVWNRWE